LTGTQGIDKAKNLRLIFMDKAVYDLPFVVSKISLLGFEMRDYDSNSIVKLERNG
jgi:hypothetical protein